MKDLWSVVKDGLNSTFEWTEPGADCRSPFADLKVKCTENPEGKATTDKVIMITNQLPDWTNNYAIANYGTENDSFTVVLNTDCTEVQAMDRNQATVTLKYTDTCSFVVDVHSGSADLFYFQAKVGAPVDFFNVDIVGWNSFSEQ